MLFAHDTIMRGKHEFFIWRSFNCWLWLTNQYINYLTDVELTKRPNCEQFVTQMIFFYVQDILQTALHGLLERQIYGYWFLSAQETAQFF